MFKLAKHTGLPMNGMLQGFAPATALQTRSNIESGTIVQIASDELDIGATNVSVAGILAVTAGDWTGPTGGNEAYTGTDDHLPFIPVNNSTLIEADVAADTLLIAGAVFGALFDFVVGGKEITGAVSINGDFKIYKLLADDGTYATKVLGYFTDTEDLA